MNYCEKVYTIHLKGNKKYFFLENNLKLIFSFILKLAFLSDLFDSVTFGLISKLNTAEHLILLFISKVILFNEIYF